MATARNALVRVVRAWSSLEPEQRPAAMAALALLLSMFLPWYTKDIAVEGKGFSGKSLTPFAVFSFIEAAIFLVSAGVLLLLFFRAERRAFHLPGGDGLVVSAAGIWAVVLLVVRVFSRPDVEGQGVTVGIQWGFILAFLAAGWLVWAGGRMRAAHRAEPTAAQDPTTRVEPAPAAPPPPRHAHAAARPRPRRPPRSETTTAIAGQLSFEESAAEDEEQEPGRPEHEDVLPPPPRWENPPRRR